MSRFVVVILDGFGIGAMDDVEQVRPKDLTANTLKSILHDFPNLKLPTLEKLGLMNAAEFESKCMNYSTHANFGKCELMHNGADTFMGHQEIMGTLPKISFSQPFQTCIKSVQEHLIKKGFEVEFVDKEGLSVLKVNQQVYVGDNIEADLGMVYNVTIPVQELNFQNGLDIAKVVREVVQVNRVIAFGGTQTNKYTLQESIEVKGGKYIGLNSAKTKAYLEGYECVHLGYGVNEYVQIPYLLEKSGISTTLLGKVADIVINKSGVNIPGVDTEKILDKTIEVLAKTEKGFICVNVQQTDLAGHSQSTKMYKDVLEVADKKLAVLLEQIHGDDVLIVMADHGNDPLIQHNNHTRECVPILIYKEGLCNVSIGKRASLSDVGVTVCDYFGAMQPENGKSFIHKLNKI